ncbi:DUF805 domain-containing protein [Bremerella sp. T1]|uniref:DUF805 domain-containing protein n=1 Tax=Bremerella sp. TYQ1 TaxID=3119568 RepID=UPI001CD01043|nr:hypothetical protein [Bremerella volcania]UBM38725.1 hypothetical protein LA756_12685 [Bremerella volcania]
MTRPQSLLSIVFGLSQPVTQRQYIVAGVSLTVLKYVVEAISVYGVTKQFYSPLEFLSPVFSYHAADFADHTLLAWSIFIWTIPFLWIALTMSVRRAIDAEGISPWMALFILVPLLNLIIVGILVFTPAAPAERTVKRVPEEPEEDPQLQALIVGSIVSGLVIGALMMTVSVLFLGNYGTGLFIGSPIVMGTTSSYLFNRRQTMSIWGSLGIGLAVVSFAAVGLLMFALEGLICIVMALPLILPLGLFGALLGWVIAEATRDENQMPHISAIVICLPLLAGLETYTNTPYETVVMTAVDIDASPTEVWETVIAFPEIETPPPWYFQLGIASPQSAYIEGHGVGAVRHCEFTTGEFVEPVTVWDEPHRLAFDVTEQPDPLVELSPFRGVHPPHLDGYMRSNRGEFRLVRLANGKTRLEGRTWYQLEMFPQAYWMLWSDMIVHRIHLRVLDHIRETVETN